MSKQPMQPIERDGHGVIRFRQNAIVSHLLDFASKRGCDMNTLACMSFTQEDREQFAQLIGYSVSGFGELSYADHKTVRKADRLADDLARKGA